MNMQHYIAIYAVSKGVIHKMQETQTFLEVIQLYPRAVKVLLLDTSVYHTHASPIPE